LTFLVDANVIVYAASVSPFRTASAEIIDAVTNRDIDGRISTAILEEIWHVELSGKVPGIDGLAKRAHALFSPLLPVTDDIVARALELPDTQLGSNDRIHVATALENGIDTIVSFDLAFDLAPRIRRVDPMNDGARSRLLRG